jgi:hypothetical protein
MLFDTDFYLITPDHWLGDFVNWLGDFVKAVFKGNAKPML